MAATDHTRESRETGRPAEEPGRVGTHVASVLEAAEEAAEEIRRAAREEAATLLGRAREEARETRRDAEAAGARTLAEAEEQGQGMIAAAKDAARAVEERTANGRARLRLQVRELETQLEQALDALRALDGELLDPGGSGEQAVRVPIVDQPASATGGIESAQERVPSGGGEPSVAAERAVGGDGRRDLLDRARELGVKGRLQMTTEELARAVGERSGTPR